MHLVVLVKEGREEGKLAVSLPSSRGLYLEVFSTEKVQTKFLGSRLYIIWDILNGIELPTTLILFQFQHPLPCNPAIGIFTTVRETGQH